MPNTYLNLAAYQFADLDDLPGLRAHLLAQGQTQRNICLIPASAHGTNPASAQLAGQAPVSWACARIARRRSSTAPSNAGCSSSRCASGANRAPQGSLGVL